MTELIKKRKDLKTKLRERKPMFSGWTSLSHPSITEIFAKATVDFIGIDMEHSTISQEQSQRIISAAHSEGSLCLPRTASHNMEMIKRLLDSGCDGIIVPMVNTPDEAEVIASWCKYPPKGKRSFGVSRAQGYGFDFDEYIKTWNESSSLIVQIESKQGVDNIEEILSIEEIDGAMIGPYDLSGSLGIPGELEHPEITKSCDKVIKACQKYHKACGTQILEPGPENITASFSQGYTFIVLSSDVFLLWKWSNRMREIIHTFRR